MNSNGLSRLPPLMQSSDLMQEQRTELPRPYKCHLCEKAFHRLEHQTRHIRTHTGEKPHVCNYTGCTKRFSRPDELTRHSRIHTNPNSRRSNKNQHQAALAAAAQAVHNDPSPIGTPKMMPPPSKGISKSAPASHVGSPNVSPPHSYHGMHTPPIPSGLSPFGRATSSPSLMGVSHHQHQVHSHHQLGLDMLAQTASQQLDRERYPQSHHYGNPFNSRPAPFALVHGGSQPMSRSRSHEDDDAYSRHRSVKKSRPSSPVSTAPSSPTFSHYDSCSPTPEGTPLATPAHSPRLYPRDDYSMQLPSIRHLSLRAPLLAPMEVAPHVLPTPSRGLGLSDLINRPDDSSQRKLPASTRVSVQYLLNDTVIDGYTSTSSSTANSVAGNDLADRS
jgi:zinc-finger protein CreA/MIG